MADRQVVVVCMDGSDQAEEAFQWYVKSIHTENNYVIILHCVDHRQIIKDTYGSIWQPAEAPLLVQAFREQEELAVKTSEKLQKTLESTKVTGEVMTVSGEPGPKIIEVATDRKAVMILTGCRGLGTIRRTFLGSVSDYVLHHSYVPVLVYQH